MQRLRVLSTFAIFVFVALTLQAQTFRGGIQGTVTDSTGAAISGAQITVTNPATGLTRPAVSDAEGNYFVNELPLGSYSVTATKSGFRTKTATDVQIAVATPQRVDLQLTPGQVTEKIEVTAEVPLIETSNNNQGGVIDARQAENLPINGRDYLKLFAQIPGANGDPSGEADSPGSFGYLSVNGNRGRSDNYLIDGTDMNDGYRNDPIVNEGGVFSTPATILPTDAIAEMPVISGGEAEYGRNSGAIVNVVTKSGTNDWHGDIFEYLRNQNLDARNFFNPDGTPQNPFNNNQFGGSLGGPVYKDHTFFFVSYEGQREHGGIPSFVTVPTQGDILNFTSGGGIVNPITANLLALNPWHVPQANLTTTGSGFPLPAGPAGGATLPASDAFNNRVDSLIVKLDQNLRGNQDRFTTRYFYGNSDQSFPLGLIGGGSVPGYNTVTPTSVHIASTSYTWVYSPKLLIEFRGGYNRFYENFLPQDRTFNPASIGLNTGVTLPQDLGLPHMNVSGYSSIGATSGINRGRTDQNYQFFNNYSYTAGNHNFKWGYEFRRTNVSQYFDAGYRSQLNFSSLADFLSGTIDGGHQLRGYSHRDTFQNNHGFYFQDNWKFTPRLTLNLGMRWDYFGVIGENKDRFSIFDPTTQLPKQVGQLYPKDFNNFGPRASFAYDVFGDSKTILRGGWGLFYDAFSQDFFEGELPFPTFNAGPAYNFIGANNPASINLSYQPNNTTAGMGVNAPGVCNPGDIVVPNAGGLCAGPTFLFSPTFGNDTFTVAQSMRTPYIQNYNLNVEHQFSDHISWQAGYVGSTGRKLFHYVDINQCNVTLLDAGLPCHPFPNAPGFGYVLQFQSSATSQYNSLQTTLNFRNWHHLNSTANYVWSHSIDTASDGQDYVPNASQPDNSYNPGAERASSNFDIRHRFSWNLMYDLPNANTAKWITNGWSLESVAILSSGQPYNVSIIDNFCCDFNGTGEFYGRPDIIGNPFAGTGGLNILNLTAFAVPCSFDGSSGCLSGPGTVPQHIGDLGRNAFVGPTFKNWDFSIVKTNKIGERLSMQWRVDFFNILNHPNFTNPLLPNFEVDMAQSGICTGPGMSTLGAAPSCNRAGTGVGFLQPTATPDVAIGDPSLGGGGARNIQVALKLSF
jgi:hypothetical protein